MSYNFFRCQMELDSNGQGDIFQLCWKKPIVDEQGIPKDPYVEIGIFDLDLSSNTEVKEALGQVLSLAIPLATEALNTPPETPTP